MFRNNNFAISSMGKILAIDDVENNLLLLKEVVRLYKLNLEVVFCTDPFKAFETAKTIQPDIILLDIQMPGMDGFQVCELIKSDEDTRNIPVLFITAVYTDFESRVKGLDLGAEGFIAKPFKPEELIAQIKVMLRIKKTEDLLKEKNLQLELLLNEKSHKLEESEKKYESMFHNNHAVMFLVDPSSLKIVDANPAACNFYGYSYKEFTTKKVTDISFKSEAEVIEEIKAIKEDKNQEVFYEHKLSNGTKKAVEIFSGLIEIEKKAYILSIIHDVSERKRMQQELTEQSRFNEILLNAIPNPIFYKNNEGSLIGYNKAYEESFGNIDVERSNNGSSSILQSGEGNNGSINYETVLVNKNRLPRNVNIYKSVISDSYGGAKGIVSTIIDITEKKRQEEKLKEANNFNNTLIDVSPYGIIVYRKTGECILANDSARNMVGASDREQILKQNFHEIESWRKSSLYETAIQVLENKTSQTKLVNLITSFGAFKWLEVNMIAVDINNEDNLVILISDQTSKKESEKQINQSLEYQKLISYAGIKLNETNRLQNSLNTVLNKVSEFVGASNSSIFQFSDNKVELEIIGEWDKDPDIDEETDEGKAKTIDLEILMQIEDYLVVENASEMPEYLGNIIDKNITKSFILLPLKENDDLLGLALFEQRNYYNSWNNLHIEVLKGIVYLIANAVTREKMLSNLSVSEEKFRQLATNIDDAVVIVEGGTLIYHNDPFYRIIGEEKAHIGKPVVSLLNFLSADDKKKVLSELRTNSKDNNFLSKEMKVKLGNRELWIWLRIFSIENDKGEIYRHVIIISDITERKEIENQIMQTIINTEEIERKRFAEDLHDGIGPLLSGVKLYVNLLKLKTKKSKQDEIYDVLLNIEDIIQEAVKTTRSIANDLTPNILNDYGLEQAIGRFVNKINKAEAIEIELVSEIGDRRFSKEIEINLYRILKELINNSIKHSKCNNISIHIAIDKDNNICFMFRDNGVGCNLKEISNDKENGLGLNNLINRSNSINGNLKFKSKEGDGFSAFFNMKLTNTDYKI